MHIRNVLIFPAGTEIGLEIYAALKDCKEVNLYGAGQDLSNHAKLLYSEYHVLPSIHEENWLDALACLCLRLKINYIFPAYDDVVVALSKVKDRIPAVIIAPTMKVCEITRSKSLTYAILKKLVRVPQVYERQEEIKNFPVFVKPDRGQGSYGVKKVSNVEELLSAIGKLPNPIISEYLPGEEYTVDCFSDRERGLLFAGARIRRRMRNGIAVNTQTVELPEAKEIAKKIGDRLSLYGAWFFQLKRAEDGELALLEVAPRIAGSMAAHRVIGVNFPLLCIYEHERLGFEIKTNKGNIELDRSLKNRYKHTVKFDTLYVDLDDTLIFKDKVNDEVIRLIYQCINNNKKVILITRHEKNLSETLSKYRLVSLFDEVIHVPPLEKKSSYIKDSSSIFVDDSFSERLDVSIECNVPTFDVSMIELITMGTPNE